MHYTLKDMVRLTGLNERTVPKYLERYTQRTGNVRVAMRKDGRHWRYSEDDLAAVLAEKAHVEEERTRKAPAEYTHDTDVLARLAAIEAQLAVLKERASYLFTPVTRLNDNLSEQVSEAIRAPRSRPTVTTARQLAPGEWPASANGRGKWIARHGGPGTSWARTFDDVKEWQGPEDAIAAVRRHQRWREWQPRECAYPSCQCHELLGVTP